MPSVIDDALEWVQTWEARWGERPAAPAVDPDRWAAAWDEFTTRMDGNFPFFHPRFAGQMLKPPHPAAAAGYLAAMLVNPNNHALDGGPATSEMEKEAVAELAAMLGLAEPNLGHLTASGTIANLEALWVARELHPDKGDRVRGECPLHARAHVPGPSHAGARGRRPGPRGGSTSTRSTPPARAATSAPSC